MSFSGAVQWWDEWQLRVLVMGSLLVQYSLFFSSAFRKFHIPGWFRFFIWLSYLGSDDLAIYALATLFNRQKQPSLLTSSTASAHGSSGSHGLEVMWAPILLIHLAGQDPITAYNIEDNELWTRHIVTVVSQATVAVYVFRKSWSGEKRLLQAAILLFVAGFLKGSEKPWALYRASIHSLVSSSSNSHSRLVRIFYTNSPLWIIYTDITARSVQIKKNIAGRVARIFRSVPKRVASTSQNKQQGENDQKHLTLHDYVRECCNTVRVCCDTTVGGTSQGEERSQKNQEEALEKALPDLPLEPRELFVDLALPYSRRLRFLKSLMPLDGTRVDRVLQAGLSNTFDLLYTKERVFQADYGKFVRSGIVIFNFAAVGLFSRSHKHGYNKNDVIATYILFAGTAALEALAILRADILDNSDVPRSRRILEKPQRRLLDIRRLLDPVQEAVRKLINKYGPNKYIESCVSSIVRPLLQCLHCRVWVRVPEPVRKPINKCIKSCGSSIVRPLFQLRQLLKEFELEHWLRKPRWSGMVAQYNLLDFFSRNTSPNVLMKATRLFGCKDYLDRHWYVQYCPSARRITEVILEHVKNGWKNRIDDVATYKGFNNRRGQLTLQREGCDECLRLSIQKPFDESILLWHIATDLCFHSLDTPPAKESPIIRCREMSNYMIYLLFVQPEMLLAGTRQNLFTAACGELDVIFKDDKPQLDREFASKVKNLLTAARGELDELNGGELAGEVAKKKKAEDAAGTFIPDARKVYDALQRLGDEKKMWKVIEGVWVEMLCYSASRCRGYLHAKSLGTGGEYLSYVWLLLSHMGMETLADRFQKPEEPPEEKVAASASTSQSQDGSPESEISLVP